MCFGVSFSYLFKNFHCLGDEGVNIELGLELELGVSLHDSSKHTKELYDQLLVLGIGEGVPSAFDQMSKIRLTAEKVKYTSSFKPTLPVMRARQKHRSRLYWF